MTTIFTQYFLPCFWAFLACIGFCVLFDIHGFGIVLTSLGGSLGWLAYLLAGALGCGIGFSAFIAGVFIAAYAEVMARIRKCPASGYLLIAFFPLVPGAGLFYTMKHYLAGNNAAFLEAARSALSMAGGLALGVLLVSSLMRMYTNYAASRRSSR